MNDNKRFEQTFKISRAVAISVMATFVLYLITVELIRNQYKPFTGITQLNNLLTIRYILYGISVLQVIIIRILRGLLLKKKQNQDESTLIQKLFKTSILTSALCEVPVLMGLILFLLRGFNRDFYILLFVSAFLMFMFFPRYHSWKEWIKQDNSSNYSNSCCG